MAKLIGIYNGSTGENEIREMTAEELIEFNAQNEIYKAEKLAKENEEKELRTNKISVYQKLGLTEEEIEILLPTPKIINRNNDIMS
jgi:hypothetical protein